MDSRKPTDEEEAARLEAAVRSTADPAVDERGRGPLASDSPRILIEELRELGASLSHYSAAKSDRLKLAVRAMARSIFLSALGFVGAAGFLIIAMWFLLSGISRGLDQVFIGRPWMGPSVTGALALACLGLGLEFVFYVRQAASRKRTAEKYRDRQERERARFGRDVHEHHARHTR